MCYNPFTGFDRIVGGEMVKIIYIFFVLGCFTLALALLTKFAGGMVAGVGPGGYLMATVLLLLIGANLALLELLKKLK